MIGMYLFVGRGTKRAIKATFTTGGVTCGSMG